MRHEQATIEADQRPAASAAAAEQADPTTIEAEGRTDMTGLTAFGVGIAFGYLLSVVVAVLLTARGEFPHDSYYDDDPDDGPPTLLDGWHGQGAP